MTLLPAELWEKLDDSLGNLDLRLSPEMARARIQRMILLQEEGREGEHLFVSIAALALAGAMACRLQREARERPKVLPQPEPRTPGTASNTGPSPDRPEIPR